MLLARAALGAASVPAMPLDQGYHDMYDLQFEAAHKVFRDWESSHPRDPMGPVSDAAAYLFAEFDRLRVLQSEFFTDDNNFFHMRRLTPDPKAKAEFDKDLDRSGQ